MLKGIKFKCWVLCFIIGDCRLFRFSVKAQFLNQLDQSNCWHLCISTMLPCLCQNWAWGSSLKISGQTKVQCSPFCVKKMDNAMCNFIWFEIQSKQTGMGPLAWSTTVSLPSEGDLQRPPNPRQGTPVVAFRSDTRHSVWKREYVGSSLPLSLNFLSFFLKILRQRYSMTDSRQWSQDNEWQRLQGWRIQWGICWFYQIFLLG